MQVPSRSVPSCLKAFEFSNGSSSSSEQEISWNNNTSSGISRDLQGCCLSSGDIVGMPYIDGATNPRSNLNSGSLSVSLDRHDHDGCKIDSNWGSSLAMQSLSETPLLQAGSLSSGCGSIILHQNLLTAPLGHLNSDLRDSSTPQSSDINVGYVLTDIQAVEDGGCGSSQYKPLALVAGKIPFNSSDHRGSSSGPKLDLLAKSDAMSCSPMDKRQKSCKRKSLETLNGQPSHAFNSLRQAEDNICPRLPSRQNMFLTISDSLTHPSSVGSPEEQLIPTIGSGGSITSGCHLSVRNDGGISQRNSRMRIAPICHEDTFLSGMMNPSDSPTSTSLLHPTNGFLSQSDSPLGLPSLLGRTSASPNRSNVLHPLNTRVSHSVGPLDLGPLVVNSSSDHYQSNGLYLPAHHQSFLPFERNTTTNPRTAIGSLSSSGPSSGWLADASEDASSMMLPRKISGQIVLPSLSEMQLYNQDSVNWNLARENGLINTSSTPLPSSSSDPYPTASWTSNGPGSENLPNTHAEVSSLLLPSSIPNSGFQIGSFPSLHAFSPFPSPDTVLPSGSAIQKHGHHLVQSAPLIDRPRGSILGLPLSLRNQAAFDGGLRLVSEIRSVLSRAHRGSFNFEDIFILDQAVFGGRFEFRDRHRDLRLDIDNMSYEELLALEERIGDVSTGLSEDTILKCLKQSKYNLSVTEQEAFDDEPCCICQENYVDAEELGALDCGHFFHVGCIKRWLVHKNLCPICKTNGLVTN